MSRCQSHQIGERAKAGKQAFGRQRLLQQKLLRLLKLSEINPIIYFRKRSKVAQALLDDLDLAIIKALQADGRAPFDQIAAKSLVGA